MVEKRFNFVKTNSLSTLQMLVGLPWNDLKCFLGGWKDGTKGYAIFKKETAPKSKQQLGYYYAVILPHSFEAFKRDEQFSLVVEFRGKKIKMEMTIDNIDRFFKLIYAKRSGKYADKTEMDMTECALFEDFCIKWVHEWFNYQIPPAERHLDTMG